MKLRPTIAASIITLAAAGVSLGSTAAYAGRPPLDNVVQGQWYNFTFGADGSPLTGGSPAVATGTDGPLPGGGTANAIDAPDGTAWTITMTTAGYVTFTDVERAGDYFDILVNGVGATPTTNNLNPTGQAGLAGGFTSVPDNTGDYDLSDISVALGDANFSSGTFYLPVGVDTITGVLGTGSIDFGDGDFLISSAVPEPATWAMFLLGFGGIGFMLRGRRKGVAATA